MDRNIYHKHMMYPWAIANRITISIAYFSCLLMPFLP